MKLLKVQWVDVLVTLLLGFLRRPTLTSKLRMSRYILISEEILARRRVIMCVRVQCLHENPTLESQQGPTWSSTLQNKWLQLEEVKPTQIVEQVICNNYIRALLVKIEQQIRHTDVKSVDVLVTISGIGPSSD